MLIILIMVCRFGFQCRLLLVFFITTFVCACEVNIVATDDAFIHQDAFNLPEELKSFAKQYFSYWSDTQEIESFLFFTDPHLLGYDSSFTETIQFDLIDSFTSAKLLYDNLPLDFCLCGGDWLNAGDTQEAAKEKLLFADSTMKSMFSHYYKMLGNHDTNYLGIVSTEDSAVGKLPSSFFESEYYTETGSAYYSFKSSNSEFIILDSGIDFKTSLDSYRKEQLVWLAEQLQESSSIHIVLGIHMFYNTEPAILPMSQEIIRICDSYNRRLSYQLEDSSIYDYSESIGKVHLILSGHGHVDFLESESGIPIVGTCRFIKNEKPTFEICVLNYKSGCVDLIRVGEGESRHFQLCL